jgi:hypothetical protein
MNGDELLPGEEVEYQTAVKASGEARVRLVIAQAELNAAQASMGEAKERERAALDRVVKARKRSGR